MLGSYKAIFSTTARDDFQYETFHIIDVLNLVRELLTDYSLRRNLITLSRGKPIGELGRRNGKTVCGKGTHCKRSQSNKRRSISVILPFC